MLIMETRIEDVLITDEMVSRFHRLNSQAKEIESEMAELKKIFNAYLDKKVGLNSKGESIHGEFKLQRQIRKSEAFNDELTVQRLEELNLNDCIQTVKQPDKQKIEAAITLGLLSSSDLDECIVKRVSQVIIVKEINTI